MYCFFFIYIFFIIKEISLGSVFVVITGFQFIKKRMKFDYHQALMGMFKFIFNIYIYIFT